MSSILRKKQDFSIDDAFSETLEDKIRIYTTTSETAPLTETILEEPPGFETSTLSLSPGPSDLLVENSRNRQPILKNSKILQNPTLKALKAKEDADVGRIISIIYQRFIFRLLRKTRSL